MRYPALLFLVAAGLVELTACSSDPTPIAPERVAVDHTVEFKVGGGPLLTFHVQSLDTAEGPRLGVYAHNTGSRKINSATYVLRLRDHQSGRGIVFEYVGMLGALATGAKSPLVKLDSGAGLPAAGNTAIDRSDLVQIIRLDATSFVANNPFSGLYHGSVNPTGGGPLSMSGTVGFDGQTYFSIDGGINVGGGAGLIRGSLDPAGHFTGSAFSSENLAVAVVANPVASPALLTTPDGKLSGVLNVAAANQPPFEITLSLDRRSQ